MIPLTSEQMEIFRNSARQDEAERRSRLAARRQHAWDVARQAADILKVEFGASRVVVFGSLLYPERFHERSDVDLAAWDVQHYFRAVSRLLDLDPQIEINLVPYEDARPGIAAVIDREGIVL